ncbi:MAG: TonB-dependent receptor [Alistipes sp.]|nr:TonB-dependent receptor [Alistipes sp.]
MKKCLTILALLLALPLMAQEPTDSLHHDIELVEISASLKSDNRASKPISATTITMAQIEQRGIGSIKELSLIAPNFYQPDYGSSITSSIYVRGFGSRIDQPVLGLTIDDVPVMNKNSYDFDLFDIRRIELLRGPQGTLYGRNTSGGVMNITSLSPFDWQGFRGMVELTSNLSQRASMAYYSKPTERLGVSLSVAGNNEMGYFRNTYTDTMCDAGYNIGGRLRLQWLANNHLSLDNILTAGYTDEGGYAYQLLDKESGHYNPIAYNDPSSYKRLSISDGLVLHWNSGNIRLQSTTSVQYLGDEMTLDQDFTPKSMFTLQQQQSEFAITEDIVIRNADTSSRWQWLCGLFGFAKWLDMSSPVTFKHDGVEELILSNINNGIHNVFPENNIKFDTDNFVIASDFNIPVYGTALYHQSYFDLGRWRLTAGLRFDIEQTSMDYHSQAELGYMFDYTMTEFKPLHTKFKGREKQLFWEVLPKFSVEYRTSVGNIYGTITRGYKSGGYNTQIFSDILQSKMMNDMLSDLGIELDSSATQTSYDSASATRYKPETSWNFEVGTHLSPIARLSIDAAAFWIECFDQQVTVLPKGMSTGRMMSNAARARSYGVELSVDYGYRGFNIRGDYGYTNARFRKYNDGVEEYAGKRIPYSPEHTAALIASYSWHIDNNTLQNITLSADWRGTGSIYWNEANTLRQPFYSLLGAQLTLRMKHVQLTIWGRNLLNSDYDQFYFKSVGNEFFSKGKPLSAGIKVNVTI